MNNKTKAIREALARIAKASGGILWPAKVVDAARSPKSPLHSRFEWDDSKAAEKFRLWQARQLIAITVNVVAGSEENEQVWVSLKPDQAKDGGYRSMVSVLSDSQMRRQLLEDAFADMELFERKYRHLQELAKVFAAMRHTKKQRAIMMDG